MHAALKLESLASTQHSQKFAMDKYMWLVSLVAGLSQRPLSRSSNGLAAPACKAADGPSCKLMPWQPGSVCSPTIAPKLAPPFVILTSVGGGSQPMNLNRLVRNGSKLMIERQRRVGSIGFHELFRNWLSFVPADLRGHINVLALDNSSAALATQLGVAAEHVRPPCCTTAEICTRTTVGWGYRLRATRRLLARGLPVLVSDIDAIWLHDPRPILGTFVREGADLLGLAQYPKHRINAGFVLYQPSLLATFDGLIRHWTLVTHHDQNSLSGFYTDNGTSWQDDMLTGASRGINGRHGAPGLRFILLPSQQFVRTKIHMLMEGCQPNERVVGTLQFAAGAMVCIDEKVVVLHDRGEIFRAKQLVTTGDSAAITRGRMLWRV